MSQFDPNSKAVLKTVKDLRNPFKLRLYFMTNLPSVAYWKVRIKNIDPDTCTISLPYSRRTKNPFKSIYFAAQNGAAELSTGLLASIAIAGRGRVSMLITNVEASFSKKATEISYFTCADGPKLQAAVQKAIETGEGVQVVAESIGKMENGVEIARFKFTWSFKKKA